MSVLETVANYDYILLVKVHIFLEGHKILRNLHCTVYLTVTTFQEKSTVEILYNFVAFLEYMNFNILFMYVL